jgi:hypothetical protein
MPSGSISPTDAALMTSNRLFMDRVLSGEKGSTPMLCADHCKIRSVRGLMLNVHDTG